MSEELHARLGPSNHRWPHCPGSVREEAVYPDIAGEAAVDGTGSHLLLEMCLTNGVRAETYEGQIIGANHHDKPNGWMVNQDRIDRVQMCLDYLSRRHRELSKKYPGAEVIIETESKSDPGAAFGRDDWWGTCDITVIVLLDGRCMFVEVIDYKDGRGWVHAVENTQLESYLFGKVVQFIGSGPLKVRPFREEALVDGGQMTIVQPKTVPVVRHEAVDTVTIIERGEQLAAAAQRTDDPAAPLVPDEKGGKGWCRWCKHRDNCTALAERDLEKVKVMSTTTLPGQGQGLFEVASLALGDVTQMDDHQLTELLDAEPGITQVFDRAREELTRRLEEGQEVSGWAMVPGRGTKVWNTFEEDVVKALKGRRLKMDEIMPRKMASPAMILKSPNLRPDQKKRIERDLISVTTGKDKLTRVSHKREKQSVKQMFADVPPKTEEISFL